MTTSLPQSLLDANPWLPLADRLEGRAPLPAMTLAGDAATVAAEASADFKLWLYPQPFIGDPAARHWLVCLNPGYVPQDAHEQLGDPCPSALPDTPARLARRQALLTRALRLDPGVGFYPFDAAFRTFPRGAKAIGTQNWWLRALIGAPASNKFIRIPGRDGADFLAQAWEAATRDVFVLELFPYHSARFGLSPADYAASAHVRFVLEALAWGAANGRRILVRSEAALRELAKRNGVRLPFGALFATRTRQSFFLSRGNVARFGEPDGDPVEAAAAFWAE